MKIIYFGIYNPQYSRNRVLLKGLRANDVEVQELTVKQSLGWSFRLLAKYIFMRPKFDAMVVGFPGQEVMFLARLLTGKPIVFDAFTSHYGGYILDRKKASPGSLRARWYAFLDRSSCRLADAILLDTDVHIDFFVGMFRLPRQKFHRIFVGTDSAVFYPRPQVPRGEFLVHFHGYFIPLQGTEYIIRAAKRLKDENVRFNVIGRGQEYQTVRRLGDSLGATNIHWIEKVPYEKLPDFIAQADVCLGVFGDTPKTPLVIPNKIFEAIAMAKPVITADTPAVRELFKDGENIILCRQADPDDLAQKILKLKTDEELRRRIGEAGYALFKDRLTEDILGRELLGIIGSQMTNDK